jgi:hypothetical protein
MLSKSPPPQKAVRFIMRDGAFTPQLFPNYYNKSSILATFYLNEAFLGIEDLQNTVRAKVQEYLNNIREEHRLEE